MTQMPLIIAEIERVAGIDAALKLSLAKGGRTIYTPYSVTADHWLARLLGLEAATKICEHYRVGNTGARILIPIAKQAMQRRALVEALENGASAPKAAEAAGMHERSAYRNRRRIRDQRQGKLF